MNPEQNKILESLYGERKITKLEKEIGKILIDNDLSEMFSKDIAQQIYSHLAENVMRQADLINYEIYDAS